VPEELKTQGQKQNKNHFFDVVKSTRRAKKIKMVKLAREKEVLKGTRNIRPQFYSVDESMIPLHKREGFGETFDLSLV